MKKHKILLVDDNEYFLNTITKLLGNHYNCIKAVDDAECFEKLGEYPDVILQDIEINSEKDGIDIVRKIKENHPEIPVIMLTKHSDYRTVKEAMQAGAIDYIVKPPDINELKTVISRALQEAEMKEKFEILKKEVRDLYGELVGNSERMKEVKDQIRKAAENDFNVLITGETGTGKELAARLIHEMSDRKNEPFISINISAIEKEMFLSEIFGHERGAFTGAYDSKKGLFEMAGNGTIFLDEIGDLEKNVQIKLLRIIEEKKVRRIGGIKDNDIGARIIAATNQDLQEKIKKQRFRKDLFFRLNAFTITMPSLTDIKEDIPGIIDYYVRKCAKKPVTINGKALSLLKNHSWHGNVRELKNVLERALIYAENDILTEKDINPYLLTFEYTEEIDFDKLSFKEVKDRFVKDYLINLLKKNNYNVTRAAQSAGIERPYLYRLIKKHNIDIPKR